MSTKHEGTGERIRAARQAAGMTITELADAAGTSQPSLSQIELGKRQPQIPLLRRLAAALGVRTADLLGD